MKRNLSIKLSAGFIFLNMIFGVLSLMPWSEQKVANAATQVTALVYRGPVVGCDGCSEAVAGLLESDTAWDFNVIYVGPDENYSVQQGLALPNVALYAQPGGDGDLDSAWNKVSGNATAIRNFVNGGGRYLGFCMGGYFVDDDPGYALGIDTDQYIASDGADTNSENDIMLKINWRGTNRWIYFQDGSYFIPKSGVAGQIILARFTNNLVAAMVQPYGSGKVGVSGPHPESHNWGLSDPDGEDWDLGRDLIDTLMAGYAGGGTTQSSAKAITTFTLAGVAGTINNTSRTIAVNLPSGTSVTSIVPTITVSAKATISPTSGTAKNFTSPVTYTVTAEDGSTQTYTVTATVAAAKSSAKAITAFTLAGVAGTINNTSRTIAVNLPAGTSVTSITPVITVSAKATVSPTSGTAKNFTSPVTYTVTAEDGSTQTYTVTATVAAAKSSAKAITAFTLAGQAGTINNTSRTIAVNLPSGTSVTSIVPTITVSAKATISPTSGTSRNFSSPVVYTVTAEDGTTQAYTVTVTVATVAKSSAKAITAFTLAGKSAVINETSHTISVNLPVGTSVTSISPIIAISAKATVIPASGTSRSFTGPVIYTVTAEDGTTQTYTVTVTVDATAKSSAKAITNFTLSGVSGTINETSRTIAVNLPAGTSLTSIAPTITVSAKATVAPTSGTARNFTSPVIYTVTAEDGSTQSYVVTVTVSSAAQSSAKAITAFILGGKTGVINETDHSISVSLPSGTNVTALVPDIYLSVKSTVSPGSGAAKNYTNPVNYIVTAENGTIQAYVVTVTVGASTNSTSPIGTITYSIKTPTSGSVIATLVPSETVTVNSTGGFTHTFTQNGTFTFTFTDSDGNTGTATATVNNIDKTTPTITLNGNSTINLTTGTAYNEQGAIATDNTDGSIGVVTSGSVNTNTAGTYIITYVATDAAGNVTTITRTVKVTGTNTTTSENAILSFAFKTLSPDVFGIIDETNHTVLLTVPAGTNLTALVPTIRVSDGATVNPTSETAQNFTTPKIYTVTSSTGAKQTYTVTVKKETINLPLGIFDGDIIQCKTSFNPFAVYIVKIVGDKIYIRHIVSLEIFNYYKHLQWANLKQVSSLSPYSLSGWVRVNTGSNGRPGANDKVYEVNGDQTKHWINMTAQQFLTHGGSDEAIFTVNSGELKLYKTGVDVMSL